MNWHSDDKATDGWAETVALPTKLHSNAHIELETKPNVEK